MSVIFLKTLNARILLTVTGIVCFTLTLSMFLGLWQTTSIVQDIQKKNAEVLLDTITHIVENEYRSIQFHRQSILNIRKEELKNVVNIAYAVLDDYHNKSLSAGYDQKYAQSQVLQLIKQMRWGDDVGYFWINDTTQPIPKMIMHPTLPGLDGTILADPAFNCALGRNENLFRAANLVSKESGSGYVDYLWPKPTADGKLTSKQPKVSFVRRFEPWQWIIGSGVYIDDVEAEAKQRLDAVLAELRQTFQDIHIGENSYMFMFTSNKKMLIHPELQGKDVSEVRNPVTGKLFFDEIVHAAQTSDQSIDYKWSKPDAGENELFSKKLYVSYFEPLEWYICVSYYQEEVNQPAKELGWRVLTLSLFFLFLAFLVSYFLGRSVTAPLKRLSLAAKTIAKKGIGAAEIPISGSRETRYLGEVLSQTLATLGEKEKSFRESELKYRQLVENVNDAIFIAQDGAIKFANNKTAKLTGYSIEELKKVSFAEIVHPDDQAMVGERHLRRLRGEKGIPDIYTFRMLTKNNIEQILLLSTVMVEWQGEAAVLCCARDITAQRKLETAFFQAQKMDAVGQLAGGIAHDFNNMLSGILGAAQLLSYSAESTKNKEKEYIDLIIKTVGQATDLTSKLLAFGRKGKAMSQVVDVHSVIDDVYKLLDRTLSKKVEFVVEKHASNFTSTGDSSAIQNALMNLCINASHSMPDGGKVHIKTRNMRLEKKFCDSSQFDIAPGEFIDIEIKDGGCGIPEEHLEKIFEPFFTTKEQGRGTGLGLAAVYGTFRDHQGAITVKSQLGVGTVFHVYLPCTENTVRVEKIDKRVLTGTGLILLVDDEEVIRITGKKILEILGYEVIVAENGREAVDIFRKRYCEIDVVLMDMVMPEMDGAEAFRKMKEIDSYCQVIIATGFTNYDNLSVLHEQGLAGFIHKPFTDHELSKILIEVFGKGRAD